MRTCICAAAAALLAASSILAENVSTPVNPPYAFSRGLANMMFGWLELPRGVVYENARIPVVGFVAGPVKGAALTTWRTMAGTMDVVCMGLTRDGLYTKLVPEFVWDADWVPACGEDMVSMESIESEPCTAKPKPKVKKHKVIIKEPCGPCAEVYEEGAPIEAVRVTVDGPEPPVGGEAPMGEFVPAAPAREQSGDASGRRVPFGLELDDEIAQRVQAMEEEIAQLEERVAPMRDSLSLPADRERAQAR